MVAGLETRLRMRPFSRGPSRVSPGVLALAASQRAAFFAGPSNASYGIEGEGAPFLVAERTVLVWESAEGAHRPERFVPVAADAHLNFPDAAIDQQTDPVDSAAARPAQFDLRAPRPLAVLRPRESETESLQVGYESRNVARKIYGPALGLAKFDATQSCPAPVAGIPIRRRVIDPPAPVAGQR